MKTENPAIQAAEASLAEIRECLDRGQSFCLEAGAGSGKTESLVRSLRYLIDTKGTAFLRKNQRIACITYTNVASDEIASRIDGHPAVFSSTIHAFCWSLIKDFQPYLRKELPELSSKWTERLDEAGGINGRDIEYDLGYPSAKQENIKISLHHDDVLPLTVKLMEQEKFRHIFTSRHPVLFIDEYQDTDRNFVLALQEYFLNKDACLTVGFFGDYWQRIYDEESCGKIENDALVTIEQKANFRSVRPIVDVLNRMRPELPQDVAEPDSVGVVAVYHTNEWSGDRRGGKGAVDSRGGHWKGDLPAKVAHEYLESLKAQLSGEGWDFANEGEDKDGGKGKILMLTHGVLASEQGYEAIDKVFTGKRDAYTKKEDPHIKFLVEVIEPLCIAYESKKFGEMFRVLNSKFPTIKSYKDKAGWAVDMNELLRLRQKGSIGDVFDHLKNVGRIRLPGKIRDREDLASQDDVDSTEAPESIKRVRELRSVSYKQVIALASFINEQTPFSTKHGVKGAEFENVLVIAGRGWNKYDFNQLLEWFGDKSKIPDDKITTFERNRNLFYVACSRPKKRLAILFTQKLSPTALATLDSWFGSQNVHAIKSA